MTRSTATEIRILQNFLHSRHRYSHNISYHHSIGGDVSEEKAFVSPCNWRHVSFSSIIAYQNHSRARFHAFCISKSNEIPFFFARAFGARKTLEIILWRVSAQKHVTCEPVRFALCLLFPHSPVATRNTRV